MEGGGQNVELANQGKIDGAGEMPVMLRGRGNSTQCGDHQRGIEVKQGARVVMLSNIFQIIEQAQHGEQHVQQCQAARGALAGNGRPQGCAGRKLCAQQ